MSATEKLLLTTSAGLFEVLEAEAARLGKTERVAAGVELVGPVGVHRRANLELRCAERVTLLGKERVDTSGELLYRRGFRQEVSRAPLRETLAAGVLAIAGYTGKEPLWDPLCGSGTLVIEAAMIARDLAPGLSRKFAFEELADHDFKAYAREKETLRARAKPKVEAMILGTDLNAGALGTARRNAGRAGVLGDLTLERQDATVARKGLPEGTLVVSNLPYGIRVGEAAELPGLYRKIVAALRASGVERAAFLAKDPRAKEWLGLGDAVEHPISNGGIRCVLVSGQL